jgi:hypothetical protein
MHASLMRDYRGFIMSAAAVTWSTDAFDREAAWKEAMSRWAVS